MTATKDNSPRPYSSARDRLKSLTVARIGDPGIYHDGGGLYLQVSPKGSKSWFFRYRLHGRLRDMGLGSFIDFSLAEARERARLQRQLLADKIDPIDHRDSKASEERVKIAQQISFKKCAEDYHSKNQHAWKNAKHRDQWINTLTTYAFPMVGSRLINSIGKSEVLKILEPIWHQKPETASRVRQRIKTVLDWAAAKDYYPNYPHGMWVEIGKALGQSTRTSGKQHLAACPYKEVADVIAAVRASNSKEIVKLAFEFTVLTAARSGESRGAKWSEIDLNEKVWSIPAARMKAKKEHRVPLSTRCLAIVEQAKLITGGESLVFGRADTKKSYSDAVFTSLIRKGLQLAHTMHGFRSSFRDWGSEKTEHARELLEVSLAHIPGDQTESAYWRSDVIERRRQLMEDWTTFATRI